MLADASKAHMPKADKGNKPVRIMFGTQIGVSPPTFTLSLNHPVGLHFSYKRYLENQIRAEYGFLGTPIRLVTKSRRD
jgi:GTP-binding protein